MRPPRKTTTLMHQNDLHFFFTLELHAPEFDCKIDGVSDAPATTGRAFQQIYCYTSDSVAGLELLGVLMGRRCFHLKQG